MAVCQHHHDIKRQHYNPLWDRRLCFFSAKSRTRETTKAHEHPSKVLQAKTAENGEWKGHYVTSTPLKESRQSMHSKKDGEDDEWQGRKVVPKKKADGEKGLRVTGTLNDDEKLVGKGNPGCIRLSEEETSTTQSAEEGEQPNKHFSDDESPVENRAADKERLSEDESCEDQSDGEHVDKVLSADQRGLDLERKISHAEASFEAEFDKGGERPETLQLHQEVSARVIHISKSYAVLEPIFYPHSKGPLFAKEIKRDRFPLSRPVIADVFDVGDVVRVMVMEFRERGDQNTPIFSVRRVPPVLNKFFQPVTMAVLLLPVEMTEQEIRKMFIPCGDVVHVRLSDAVHADEWRRVVTFVTFRNEAGARKAAKMFHNKSFRYKDQIRYKIIVRKAKAQTYRKELQQYLKERHKRDVEMWSMTPQDWRLAQRAQEELRDIIPHYDPDQFFWSW